MGKSFGFKQLLFLILLGSGMLAFHSCAVYTPYSYTPVTVPDIVKMSQDKVPAKKIISDIKKSHTAYTLKASEYAKLQQEGVSDSVVNFMQETHLRLVRQNQRMQDSYYGNPYGSWYGGWGYGWPYYGYGYWGWNPSPIIIYRGGDHDGGFRSHAQGGFHGSGHRGGVR
jgi:hypothetical protein